MVFSALQLLCLQQKTAQKSLQPGEPGRAALLRMRCNSQMALAQQPEVQSNPIPLSKRQHSAAESQYADCRSQGRHSDRLLFVSAASLSEKVLSWAAP